jgi:hypothetical protein
MGRGLRFEESEMNNLPQQVAELLKKKSIAVVGVSPDHNQCASLKNRESKGIIAMNQPGSFVFVPADTWHTSRMRRPSRMIFNAPGEATQNKPA